jgi:hypothetical protein
MVLATRGCRSVIERMLVASLFLAVLALLALRPAVAEADHDSYAIAAEFSSGSGLGFTANLSDGLGLLGPSPTALGGKSAIAELGAGTSLKAADSTSGDFHSANFRKLDRETIQMPGGEAQGSDLAFQGNLLVAGAYEGVGFYRIGEAGDPVRQLSFFDCPGSQGDVSILGKYVFVSIDTPSSNNKESAVCNNTRSTAGPTSLGKEGVRIVDISSVRNPRQVGFVETECGSHTHTLIPGKRTSHIYVDSYPLTQQDNCTEANHPEGEFSVIRFPTADPRRAQVVAIPDVLPPTVTPDAVGCHDTGVLPAKKLAVASCLGAFAVLDISDPVNPKTLSYVQNAAIELDHSAQLTWDGKYAVIGDEHAGAAGGGGCSIDQKSPIGAMWFYDITDRANPVLDGSYSLPRVPPVDSTEEAERFRCTTHNYMILPMRDSSRYVVVSPYYSGGLSVVDFSDPGQPRELGYYLPQVQGENPDMWSGYWYGGRIYSNEHASQLGVSAFRIDGFGERQVLGLGGRLNPQTQVR